MIELKQSLTEHLLQHGAWAVGVADPDGAAVATHVDAERAPRAFLPECRSVVVVVVPATPETNNTYVDTLRPTPDGTRLCPTPEWIADEHRAVIRLKRLMQDHLALRALVRARELGMDLVHAPRIQQKLWAYAAGLGVYGRSGVLLHPELGNRMALDAFLTDAALPPDAPLERVAPCDACGRCIEACPAGALDGTTEYPASFDRETCDAVRSGFEAREIYCHSCWASCPAAAHEDAELVSLRRVRAEHE